MTTKTEELLEKFYSVYSPSDVIEYWKRGLWTAEECLEKLEGFIDRHPITFNSLEGEAYQRGREDGIRMVISWIKQDNKEQELTEELKQLFPNYYKDEIEQDKHGHLISIGGNDPRDADNHPLTTHE